MGSPQRPPLAHVFRGTFVHSRPDVPMEILHGRLLGVDDDGTVRGTGPRGDASTYAVQGRSANGSRSDRGEGTGGGGTSGKGSVSGGSRRGRGRSRVSAGSPSLLRVAVCSQSTWSRAVLGWSPFSFRLTGEFVVLRVRTLRMVVGSCRVPPVRRGLFLLVTRKKHGTCP